jgi:hypothetical protein
MTGITLLNMMLSLLWQGQADVANQFNGYLILGYLVMWIVGLVYIISLATRQRNLQQDIQLMQRLLQENEEDQE